MFFESFLLNLTVIIVLVVALIFDYVTKFFSYWYVRHIPNKIPIPFYGTDYHRILGLRTTTQEVNSLCSKFQKDKFVGSIKSRIPDLIVKDPANIKKVLCTDFANFHSRGLALDKTKDFCLRNNPFYAEGEKWTLLREELDALLNNITCSMNDSLREHLPGTNEDVNVQQLLSTVLDAILTNLLFTTKSDVRIVKNVTSKLQKVTLSEKFKTYVKSIFPCMYILLGMKTFSENEIISKKELEDSKLISAIRKTNLEGRINAKCNKKTSDLDIANSVLAMFINEGYMPCLYVLTGLLFEMAKNREVQDKLRKQSDSDEYLELVIKEALRMHPPYSVITRQCVKAYQFTEDNIYIDKHVTLNIPVEVIHSDSRYYKDAEKFVPERFLDEVTVDKENYTYLPFGAGPRKCIGERLGLQIIRNVTKAILQDYEIKTSSKTPRQLPVTDLNFGRIVTQDLWLKFNPIAK